MRPTRLGDRCAAFVPAAIVLLLAAAAAAALIAPRSARSDRLSRHGLPVVLRGLDAPCRAAAREALAPYPWPLKPFHRQHAVRGDFGDPRVVITGPHQGHFSFHNGIDISAWTGNQVYPVASGRVVGVFGDEIVISSPDGRRFQYIHVQPRVQLGEQVLVSRTVLGYVFGRWNHVHLTELRHGCVVNPLAPGHLTPYTDHTTPTVGAIEFATPAGLPILTRDVHGEVDVIARAWDEPALPAPGAWRRMPVSPALLTWQITTAGGRRLIARTAADFRETEPPAQNFCTIYAPGTRQNFAAEGTRYLWGHPGRYRFQLTPDLLNTSRFANGRYRLTVIARDTAGNTGSRTVTFEIRNRQAPVATRVQADWRCPGRSFTAVSAA